MNGSPDGVEDIKLMLGQVMMSCMLRLKPFISTITHTEHAYLLGLFTTSVAGRRPYCSEQQSFKIAVDQIKDWLKDFTQVLYNKV